VVCFATALRFSAFISLGALCSEDRKTKSGIQEKVMAFIAKQHGFLSRMILAAMFVPVLHSWCYHRQGFAHRPHSPCAGFND
jgi:hypothetical protein